MLILSLTHSSMLLLLLVGWLGRVPGLGKGGGSAPLCMHTAAWMVITLMQQCIQCHTPVPRPPSFEQLPRLPRSQQTIHVSSASESAQNAILVDTANRAKLINLSKPPDANSASHDHLDAIGEVAPANLCPGAGRRVRANPNTPQAQGQAQILTYIFFNLPPPMPRWWPPGIPDGCDGYNAPYGCPAEGCSVYYACSGNTISSGLVLTAAHCMDPVIVR
jgi:hypothetical protein